MKLFWKVLLTALIPLIFVLGFSLFQVERSVRIHEASVEAENKLKTSLLQVRLSAFLSDMKKTQAILSGSNEVARAVQAADTDFLTYWGQMFLDESSSQKIIFADRDGVVLARPHAPYIFGDNISENPAFRVAASGRDTITCHEIDMLFSIISAAPVRLYGEDHVGVILVAVPVTPFFLSGFVSGTGLEVLVRPEGVSPIASSREITGRKSVIYRPDFLSGGIPIEKVEIFFPDDKTIGPLNDLHKKIIWSLGFIFVVPPIVLLLLLKHHLRPYSSLMENLMYLAQKDPDLSGARKRLEQKFGTGGDETSAVASAVIRILKLLEEKIALLEQTSRTDPLTQVSNRLHLDRLLQAEMEHSASKGAPLSVIIIDLDHFKDVNDVFGHQAGDRVLYRAAQILKDTAGPAAFVGRWGGEEFLVILPSIGKDSAYLEGEKLRKAVENGDFAIERYVTISLGIATLLPGDTPSTLVHRADKGLYRAKAGGRNRTVLGEG